MNILKITFRSFIVGCALSIPVVASGGAPILMKPDLSGGRFVERGGSKSTGSADKGSSNKGGADKGSSNKGGADKGSSNKGGADKGSSNKGGAK